MDHKMSGAAPLGVIDENMLGLANPMSTIAIGRDDLVGEDRPGAGLAESVRDFVADGGRAKLRAARDAAPRTAPAPSSPASADQPRSRPRPHHADDPEEALRIDRKG